MIDDGLCAAYDLALSTKAIAAINALAAKHRLGDIERLIGVSHGYLSKLRYAEREARGPIVGLLMLLANDNTLIDKLRVLWRME